MKKLFSIIILFSIAGIVHAQEIKIGYANVEYIFNKLPEAKKIESDLKALQAQLENRIQTNYFDFQKKLANYQAGYQAMAEQVRAEKEKELMALQQSIEKLQKDAQVSFEKKSTELLQPVYAQIDKAIKETAKENHFSFILNDHVAESDIVIYADEKLNISDLVLKRMGVEEK